MRGGRERDENEINNTQAALTHERKRGKRIVDNNDLPNGLNPRLRCPGPIILIFL